MGEHSTKFEQITSIEGAILSTYDIVTPVAEMPDGQNFLVFTTRTDGADHVVVSEFQEVPAESIESYTNTNMVSLSQLSPDGLDAYMVGAVKDALNLLPEDARMEVIAGGKDIVVVPDPESPERQGWEMPENGMDIREAVQIGNGNFDADFAYDALVHNGLVEELGELYNNPGSDVDLNVLDRVFQQVQIAQNLPGYAAELKSALDEGGLGATPASLEAAVAVLNGDGPTPNMDQEPAPLPEQ